MFDDRFEENLSPVFGYVNMCDMIKEKYWCLETMSNNRLFQFYGLGEDSDQVAPALFKPVNIFHDVSPHFLCSRATKDKIRSD